VPGLRVQVGDDAPGNITRMPRERDEAVGTERVGVVPMAPGGSAEQSTAKLTQPPVHLAGIPGRITAHGSDGEDEPAAESRGDGAPGFEQGFEMRLGRFLETQHGLATVAPVRVAAGQEAGFGDPHAVLVPAELHVRAWHDHDARSLVGPLPRAKRALHAGSLHQGEMLARVVPSHPWPGCTWPGAFEGGEVASPVGGRAKPRWSRTTACGKMPRVPRRIRQLIADLECAGYVRIHGGKGSHRKFVHPKFSGFVLLRGHDGDDAQHYQERQVRNALKQVEP